MPPITRRTALRHAAALTAAPLAAVGGFARQPTAVDPYADGKLVDGDAPKPAPGSFTVAVLPDTQNYSERFPDVYLAQTRWIAENRAARNIACVLHLGDITLQFGHDHSRRGTAPSGPAVPRLLVTVPVWQAGGNG